MICKKLGCNNEVTHSRFANYCQEHSKASTTKKKIMDNPLKKGINKGKSYLEYLRQAVVHNSVYKSDLERAERKGDVNDINFYVLK